MLILSTGLVGLAAGAVLVYSDAHNTGQLAAYKSAHTCAAASDALSGDSCRYSGPALATGTSQQSTLSVKLSFVSLPGRSFTATFPTDREPDASALSGSSAQGELWNGLVTEFAGVKSVQNPEFLPQNLTPAGAILIVAGLAAAAWGVLRVRRDWSS